MSSPAWTLKNVASGVTLELGAWGITPTKFTRNNMRADELELTFTKSGMQQALQLAVGEQCILYRDAVQYFVGEVYAPKRSAVPQAQRNIITLRGPWVALEEIIYMQTAAFVTADFITTFPTIPNNERDELLDDTMRAANADARQTLANYGTTSALSPSVFTGTDETTGAGIAGGAMVAQLLAFGVAKAPGLFQVGAGFTGTLTPRESATDASVAEMIRRVCRWTPDVTFAFDYSTSPPTLNAYERDTMAARSFAWATDLIEQTDITPRYDLLRNGVKLYLRRQYQVGSLTTTRETIQSAGVITNLRSVLVATLNLDPPSVDPSTGAISAYDTDPVGVATRLLQSVSKLFYEGQIGIVAQDCPNENWLSKVVNITGASGELATMRAVVQQSVEQIDRGRVTLTLGASPQLNANDIQALNKIGRKRNPGTQNGVNNHNNGGSQGTTTISPPTTGGNIPGNLNPASQLTSIDESPSAPLSDFQKSTGGIAYDNTPNPSLAFPDAPVLSPAGTDSSLFTRLDLDAHPSFGKHSSAILVSGTLDLRGYLVTNYAAAELVITIRRVSDGALQYTYYMPVTSGLGKTCRIYIPLGQIPLLPLIAPLPPAEKHMSNIAQVGAFNLQRRH